MTRWREETVNWRGKSFIVKQNKNKQKQVDGRVMLSQVEVDRSDFDIGQEKKLSVSTYWFLKSSINPGPIL